jgi:uncharacterized protein (DUF3820 family)
MLPLRHLKKVKDWPMSASLNYKKRYLFFVKLNFNPTRVMDDNSRMPYGKYQNTKMANVPPDYLIWLYENNKCAGDVRKYIHENLSILKEELEYNKKLKAR